MDRLRAELFWCLIFGSFQDRGEGRAPRPWGWAESASPAQEERDGGAISASVVPFPPRLGHSKP